MFCKCSWRGEPYMLQLTLLNLTMTGMKSFADKCLVTKYAVLHNCYAHKYFD